MGQGVGDQKRETIRMASRGREDFGLKKSSGVNYDQVLDRQIDDDRFARQRAIRAASAAVRSPEGSLTAVLWMLRLEKPPAEKPKSVGTKVAAPQSATMDAFMRMVTGKEERTIADRISDPNRPTWEQYKKDNADKLDLSGNGEKEMKEYRKQLDAAREKVGIQRRLGALTRDPDSEVRRATLPGHNDDRCNGDKHRDEPSFVEAWQTLAWRDAFSMEPYFLETISGRPLRIKQVLQGELNGFGTGLTVWPAACVLLKHLEHRFATAPDCQNALATIEKPFVLELGSGTGAVGIAAAMLLQAGRVVLTDMNNVQFIMQENAKAAREGDTINSQVAIDVVAYEWGKPPSERLIPPTEEVHPDLILISDCILPRLYPIEPLVEALALLSRVHTRILISYEHRHYQHFQPKHRFWELMQARSFVLRVLDADEYHPHYRADDIEIWEVTPPPSLT
ncbi:hypothetical protein BBJ28_00000087 [Nothophytophthora sp. Chile5]|nr:hypothetical protein BBJ28_00000087 [Nothophytophthora sp. Chile5]